MKSQTFELTAPTRLFFTDFNENASFINNSLEAG